MKIIVSPAKTMKATTIQGVSEPVFLEKKEELLCKLRQLNRDELKKLYKCSDELLDKNIDYLMNDYPLMSAIDTFDGLVFKRIYQNIEQHREYYNDHLRIVSGLYGLLKPCDRISFYRLDIGDKLGNLYEFWRHLLCDELCKDTSFILNCASLEYSSSIKPYCTIPFVTCVFKQRVNTKLVEQSTAVKMARGEMVNYCAEYKIKDLDGIKGFNRLNYIYDERLSTRVELVFIKEE